MTIHDLLDINVCVYMDVKEWIPFLERLEEVFPGINGDRPAPEFHCPLSSGMVGLAISKEDHINSRLGWLRHTPSEIDWAHRHGYKTVQLDDLEPEETPCVFQADALLSILLPNGREVSK